MNQPSCYPVRESGVVAVPGESGLRLRRREEAAEFLLNPAAVLIWHACDGQRTPDEIGAALRLEWPDYNWPDADVEGTIDRMLKDGIVRRSRSPCAGAAIVRAGFHGMWAGFDARNNYFLWMLSCRAAVIATDPGTSPIDVLFFTGEDAVERLLEDNPDCARIRVDFGRRAQGGTEIDFTIDLSGERLGRSGQGYGLPPWIDAIDWWGDGAGGKVTVMELTEGRARQEDSAPPGNWALLDAGTTTDFNALIDMLERRYGPPLPLLQPAAEDGGPAIDRAAVANSALAFITGSATDPTLAGTALLTALTTGAIPFYSGETRLLAGIDERAYIDAGIYDSADQVAAVTDMVRRDTAFYDRLLAAPAFYGNRVPEILEPRTACDALWEELFGVPPASGKPPPQPAILSEGRRLCIAMATYDDYDGVYFSIQAVRLYHPEVRNEVEFLIVDNNPAGPCGDALRELARGTKVRYIAHEEADGTAVSKNLAFLETESELVLCMDSHVLIVPGALRKLLDFYDAHPRCNDLLQGPLLWDHMNSVATHFDPVWREGMWGTWSSDERGGDPDAEPFEIPMQGMGLFTCRRDAWLGFHPEFRGFGGEEGYIHEKFRQAGRRTLCLPFLRWMHRFGRPYGPPYRPVWEDRIRNYLLGFRELGLDTSQVEAHFADYINPHIVGRAKRDVERELTSPFALFDAIYGIDLNDDRNAWARRVQLLERFGIARRVRYQRAPVDAGSASRGLARALEATVEDARRQHFATVFVFNADVAFRMDADERLEQLRVALNETDWMAANLCSPVSACERPSPTNAVLALHARSFDRLLEKLRRLDKSEAGSYDRTGLAPILYSLTESVSSSLSLASSLHRIPLSHHLT